MKNRIVRIQNILMIAVALFILKITVVSAQFKHEFSAYVGSGLSTLSYQPSLGVRSGGMGVDFGVGYTFFSAKERVTGTEKIFRELWGIHTGFGIAMYNASTSLDDMKTISKNEDDGEPSYSKFDLHTTLNNYKEIQRTVFLNIPVMGLFQFEQIYVMGGLKFGIPINGKYSSKNAKLTNEAYYPDLENWAKDQEFAGYGVFSGKKFEGNLDPGIAVILALEAGYKWYIADNLSLYTGFYFDCGLNNTIKTSTKKFIKYSNDRPADFTTNSVLTTFSDKTKVMAVGFKLRFAMEK